MHFSKDDIKSVVLDRRQETKNSSFREGNEKIKAWKVIKQRSTDE